MKDWGDPVEHNIRGVGAETLQGAASGAAIGSYFGAPGAIIGGVIGGVVGAVKSFMGGNKGEDQIMRDQYQGSLKQIGLAAEGPDGSIYNFLPGGTLSTIHLEDQEKGYSSIVGKNAKVFQMSDEDIRNPMFIHSQAALKPLMRSLGGGETFNADGMATYLASSAIEGGDPQKFIVNAYRKLFNSMTTPPEGVSREEWVNYVANLSAGNIIEWVNNNHEQLGLTKEEALGVHNSMNYLFDPNYDRETADALHAESMERYLQENHGDTYQPSAGPNTRSLVAPGIEAGAADTQLSPPPPGGIENSTPIPRGGEDLNSLLSGEANPYNYYRDGPSPSNWFAKSKGGFPMANPDYGQPPANFAETLQTATKQDSAIYPKEVGGTGLGEITPTDATLPKPSYKPTEDKPGGLYNKLQNFLG